MPFSHYCTQEAPCRWFKSENYRNLPYIEPHDSHELLIKNLPSLALKYFALALPPHFLDSATIPRVFFQTNFLPHRKSNLPGKEVQQSARWTASSSLYLQFPIHQLMKFFLYIISSFYTYHWNRHIFLQKLINYFFYKESPSIDFCIIVWGCFYATIGRTVSPDNPDDFKSIFFIFYDLLYYIISQPW